MVNATWDVHISALEGSRAPIFALVALYQNPEFWEDWRNKTTYRPVLSIYGTGTCMFFSAHVAL